MRALDIRASISVVSGSYIGFSVNQAAKEKKLHISGFAIVKNRMQFRKISLFFGKFSERTLWNKENT